VALASAAMEFTSVGERDQDALKACGLPDIEAL
jgi:hypothetical protein